MIVYDTKSLYEISSVAVNVASASSRSSPPRLNCRMERRCRPLYTLSRFRRSQSPPSSISLANCQQTCAAEKQHGYALLSLVEVRFDDVEITKKEADTDEREHDIDARAQACGLLQRKLLRFQCALLSRVNIRISASAVGNVPCRRSG